MTDPIATAAIEAKAQSIANQLRAWRYTVLWVESTDDQIVICFDFMDNAECPWQRAFPIDATHATPALFVDAINDWKKDIKARISKGEVSTTIHEVIMHYGAKRLHDMLIERQGAYA